MLTRYSDGSTNRSLGGRAALNHQSPSCAMGSSVCTFYSQTDPRCFDNYSSELASKMSPWLSTFFAIWWFPGAFVLTFR